ncbi:MAG: DUF2975 domain-containing protein [Erysipelotrichaceae bacterium]|nr:DUF2975 domain-containing protein [Erysipelotrichaceae bacterium]
MSLQEILKSTKKTIKTIRWFMISTIIFTIIIGTILTIGIVFKTIEISSNSFAIGQLSIDLKEGVFITNPAFARFSIPYTIIHLCIYFVIYLLILKELDTIISNALSSSIFNKDNTKSIRNIAIYILINGVLINIAKFIECFRLNNYTDLNLLLNNAVVSSININFKIELGYFILAYVIYILSKIFDYGQELQQLSDETL